MKLIDPERAKNLPVALHHSLSLAPDRSKQKVMVIFNLKFSMVNSNPKLNKGECKSEPESESEFALRI